MVKQIKKVVFWKRNSQAISQVDRLEIDYQNKKSFVFKYGFEQKEKHFSDEEFSSLSKKISSLLDPERLDKHYFAHKFEDDPTDYSIKFMITIDYVDKTYFAYKGVQPFKEAKYKEISSYFSDLINSHFQ